MNSFVPVSVLRVSKVTGAIDVTYSFCANSYLNTSEIGKFSQISNAHPSIVIHRSGDISSIVEQSQSGSDTLAPVIEAKVRNDSKQ